MSKARQLLLRLTALGSFALAGLPISCAQGGGDGVYGGGVQPSIGGRVNPAEPGFAQGGTER